MLRGAHRAHPYVRTLFSRLILMLIYPTLSRLPRGATRIIPLALHAGLSTEEQLRVFDTAEQGTRKVIAATNIAEVSHTTLVTWHFLMELGQCHH